MRRLIQTIAFSLMIAAFAALLGIACAAKEEQAPRMTKEDLKVLLSSKDLILIDVRYGKDWDDSELKIKGAVREDPKSFDSWYAKYPKDKTLVLYCA